MASLAVNGLKVLGSTVNALYVVVELLEKMHNNTDLSTEGVFGSCSSDKRIKKLSNLSRIANDIFAVHTFVLCTLKEVA